ncbi:M23 family metallopeptidase [Brevibacillus ruminantium]|uniref:M23 family metallopeptidase n=1 Tax=Brevibacillus ruminantium TaxID=2950604 RepID=A0ABY4WGA4_9BACL|nr:M23 family metallopeptidase [Brevibacillus ruminantium]USG65057.1 M23 family metallopeptidase [Brevibacillus ruminantium]
MHLKKQAISLLTVISILGCGAISAFAKEWPVPASTVINQYFNGSDHKGLDIRASTKGIAGDKIVAAYDGKVVNAGYHQSKRAGGSYGWLVVIDHTIKGKEIQTWYAHLDKAPVVDKGDLVDEGDKIGVMGNSGDSKGVHLHFEMRKGSGFNFDNTPVDPLDYFTEYRPPNYLLPQSSNDIEIGDTLDSNSEDYTFYSMEEINAMTPEQRIELGIPLE